MLGLFKIFIITYVYVVLQNTCLLFINVHLVPCMGFDVIGCSDRDDELFRQFTAPWAV